MIKLHRGSAPTFWTRKKVNTWTQRWLAKKCESRLWHWPKRQKTGIDKYAIEVLETWHFNKCAFCEAPLWGGIEIEHFRSKTQCGVAAFVWRNLFLICHSCNLVKGKESHEGCLKPDREDPTDYLWINPISMKLEPRHGISDSAYERAENTIKLYHLDRPELSKAYREYLNLVEPSQTRLQFLAEPTQPFSLMVRSLLAYRNGFSSDVKPS